MQRQPPRPVLHRVGAVQVHVNLFIGAVELPVAIKLLPRRHEPEDHQLDPIGNILLILVLLFLLVEGRVSGWPAWSWLLLGLVLPAASALAWWELLLYRRGGEPVIQVGLMRHRAFWAGQCLALLNFAGFTSLFFTLSILWQKGLGRGALATGLLVVPFSVASLVTAANSYRFSRRFGRVAILAGITAVFAGLALVLLALHLGGRSAWDFTGPLLLAGLGNGVLIAPNQDFVLAAVPREQAGTAGGALITAQRLGSAFGIAVVGTALFGGGGGSGGGGRRRGRGRLWAGRPGDALARAERAMGDRGEPGIHRRGVVLHLRPSAQAQQRGEHTMMVRLGHQL